MQSIHGEIMSGKGSGRRPTLVSDQEAEDNWKRIFGNKENEMFGKKPKDTGKKPMPGKKGNKC
jgi:hypothetical protein